MSALIEQTVDLPGQLPCQIRVERARRGDLSLADLLVEIDLQTFVEPTYGRYTASAMLDAGEVFLLKADEQVVGVCVCLRRWDPADEAHLLTIGIRVGWRGRGLGQRFVAWVLQALGESGVRQVSLLVGADNVRAVRIYRDLGFEDAAEVGEDPVSKVPQLMLRAALPLR